MANVEKSVKENVQGMYYVDATCIDCDTCRQLAPNTFDDAGEYSFVHTQPTSPNDERLAMRALLSCPTGSIGTREKRDLSQARNDFPLALDNRVFYCGFTSPKSYGGSSYVLKHTDGNWLIDSPKFLPNLVSAMEALGGIKTIFLTHSDDVGDVHKYAEHFKATRIIHEHELWSQPDSEHVIHGYDPVTIQPGFTVIPTPGHTKGHCVLLVEDTYLFSGDHMWWDHAINGLGIPQHYVWKSDLLHQSVKKLQNYTFEWVLPGHGRRIHLPNAEMKTALSALVARLS